MSTLLRLINLSARVASGALRIRPIPSAVLHRNIYSARQPKVSNQRQFQPTANRLPRYNPAVRNADSPNLDRLLTLVDFEIQRVNRVLRLSVYQLLALAEKQERLTGSQTLFLLRTTGSYLRECSLAEREELTNKFWELSDKQILDISHYNSLLQVRLENDTDFEPLEFLEKLRAAGLTPNRVTYQKLIQRYCNMGNVDGAAKILEFMKNENMPVSERVFNSLITGHFRAGNPSAAKEILDVMRKSYMILSNDTYTTLACGYAEAKDVDAVRDILANNRLSLVQILRIAQVMGTSGSIDAIPAVLEYLPTNEILFYQLRNTICELIVRGHVDAAVAIFNGMPDGPLKNRFRTLCFVPALTAAKVPVKDVVDILAKVGVQLDKENLYYLYTCAARSFDRNYVFENLDFLKANDVPVRTHFFYPTICQSKNEDEVFETLKKITEFGVPITVDMLADFVLPRINVDRVDDCIRRLTAVGVATSTSINTFAVKLLQAGQLEECLRLIESEPCEIRGLTLASAVGAATTKSNLSTAVKIIERCIERPLLNLQNVDIVGRFLLAVKPPAFAPAVSAVAAKKFSIGAVNYNRLKSAGFDVSELSKDVVERRQGSENSTVLPDMSIEELERHYEDLESKGLPSSLIARKLLFIYCRGRRVDSAERILKKMSTDSLSGPVCASLTDLYVYADNLPRALEFYQRAVAVKSDGFELDFSKVLNLASLLVKHGQFEQAMKLIAEQPVKFIGDEIQQQAHKFISNVVAHKGREQALSIGDSVLSKFTSIRGKALDPVLRHALEESIDAALQVFKDVYARYDFLISKDVLMSELIKTNRVDDLKDIIEMSNKRYGRHLTSVDLAGVYIENNMTDKAKEVLREIPAHYCRERLLQVCRGFLVRGLVAELEQTVKLARELSMDLDNFYHLLIKAYSSPELVDKALGLWIEAQEEDAVLSARTLRSLAAVLEEHGREVPFVVPDEFDSNEDVYEERALQSRPQRNTTDTQDLILQELLDKNQLDEACQVATKMLKTSTVRNARTFRNFIFSLSRAGEVEKLDALRPLMSETFRIKMRFDDAISLGYMHAGKLEAYLDKLENFPVTEPCGVGVFNNIPSKFPECTDRLIRIAKRFATEGNNLKPIAALLESFLVRDETDKVEELLKAFPNAVDYTKLRSVHDQLKKEKSLELSGKIFQLTSASENTLVRARGLTFQVETLLDNLKVDEANSLVQKHLDNGLQPFAAVMHRLHHQLQLLGRKPTFELPVYQRKDDATVKD